MAVSAGYMHWCVLRRNGRVDCQGDNEVDQCLAPDLKLASVSAGLYHSCGLDGDGVAHCWGAHKGPYSRAVRTLPPPPEGVRFASIACGDELTCGLDLQGKVVCFGLMEWTPPEGRFLQIAMGYTHACVLDVKGKLSCFGEEGYLEHTYPCENMEGVPAGLCQPGEQIPRSWRFPTVEGEFKDVAVGADHTCALGVQGKVFCWGADGWGDGNSVWTGQTRVPVDLPAAVQVTAGGGHSCALHKDGKVTCWGDHKSPMGKFRTIDSGADRVCGVMLSGEVKCW